MTNQTQTTLEEVMPAEDSWDWFGNDMKQWKWKTFILPEGEKLRLWCGGIVAWYSLADLLANPSICKAWWGEYTICNCDIITNSKHIGCKKIEFWDIFSDQAFQILRDEGNQQALNYIHKTKK